MDPKQFETIAARLPESCRPLAAPQQLPRGFSGMIGWRWQSARGGVVCKGHRLRQLPPSMLLWQQRLRNELHRAGIEWLPVPIKTADDQWQWIANGRVWELQSEIPGDSAWVPSATRCEITAVIRALGRIHRAAQGFDSGPSPSGTRPAPGVRRRIARLREHRAWLAEAHSLVERFSGDAEFQQLARRALEMFAVGAPRWERVLAPWLERALPIGPCLRDVRPEDVYLSRGELCGFVDTAAASLDLPFVDVARLAAELRVEQADWEWIVDAYVEEGVPVAGLIDLAAPLAESTRWISALNWIRAVADDPSAGVLGQAKQRLAHFASQAREN